MKKMNLLVIGCLSLIGCSATLSVFALTDAPTDPISVNLQQDAYDSLKAMMSKWGLMKPIVPNSPISLPRTATKYPNAKIPYSAGTTQNIPLDVFGGQNIISYLGVRPWPLDPLEMDIVPLDTCITQIDLLKSGDTLDIYAIHAPGSSDPKYVGMATYDCKTH